MATAGAAGTHPSVGELVRGFPAWVRQHLPTAVITALGGAVVGYVANVWIMAVRYDGFATPSGTPATSEGNWLRGGLFWALLSAVAFSVVGYGRAVGWRTLAHDLGRLPSTVASLFRADGAGARIHLLWGAATGMLFSALIAPAMSGLLAVAVLAAAPTVFGTMLVSVAQRAWSAVMRTVAPTGPAAGTGFQAMTIGLLGVASSLAVGFLVSDRIVKVVLAAVLAGVAIALGRWTGPSRTAAVVLVVAAGAAAVALSRAGVAWADDGGFAECGSSWSEWLRNCDGAGRVRRLATGGAIAAAIGAPIGSFAGSVAGAWRGRTGPPGLSPEEADRRAVVAWVQGLVNDPAFQAWRAANPQFTGSPYGAEFEMYMRWRHAQGLPDPPLVLPSQHMLPPDLEAERTPDELDLDALAARDASEPPPNDLSLDGDGVPGPTNDTARQLWDSFADGQGRIRDASGNHIMTIDADGRVTDLAGNPVAIVQDDNGLVVGFERPDGRFVQFIDGQPTWQDDRGLFHPDESPRPSGYPPELSPTVRNQWSFLNAGPNGELYGEGGRVIGTIDADGNTWTNDGRRITTVGTPEEGRIPWVMTDDGQHFGGDGRPTSPPGIDTDAARAADAEASGDAGLADLVARSGPADDASHPGPQAETTQQPLQGAGGQDLALAGDGVDGPRTDTARELWTRYADGQGRIRDANGNHIMNVDADGRITDLSGNPVTLVQDAAERVVGFERPDGRSVFIDINGEPRWADENGRVHPDGSPRPSGYPPELSPTVRNQWSFLNAGPNGELYGEGGRVIGTIDADGNTWTNDGRRITTVGTPEEGRIPWVVTDDGQRFGGDGRPAAPPAIDMEAVRAADAEAAGDPRLAELVRRTQQAEDASRRAAEAQTRPSGRPPDDGSTRLTGQAPAPDTDATRLTGQADTRLTGPAPAPDTDATRLTGQADTRLTGPAPAPDTDATRLTGQADTDGARPTGGGIPVAGGDSDTSAAPADAEAGPRAPADAEPGRTPTTAPGTDDSRPADVDAGPRGLTVYSRLNDIKSFQDALDHYRAQGCSDEMATLLAAVEVQGGNAAGDSKPLGGVTDMRLSMTASGLLPQGVQNAVIPDKVVQNYLRTGLDALNAVSETAGASWDRGEVDWTALDRFGQSVADRPGADPFSGYAQVAQLAGEEWARAEGDGLVDTVSNLASNLAGDLSRISASDVGEALLDSASEFQQEVAAGQHGTVLQGVNEAFAITASLVTEPGETLTTFARDLANIAVHGVGDGFWEESLQHTDQVLSRTPVVNTIYDGYKEIFGGLARHAEGESYVEQAASAVTGFGREMGEGAAALAGEAVDAVSNAASNAYDYLRSWF